MASNDACEFREYFTQDKSSYGPGPWMSEPDKRQWTDEATGLPCLIVRAEGMGHLCGYVGVPEGHPLFKVHYASVEMDIDVHGGLTFSDMCADTEDESKCVCHVANPGQPEHVWWFGFDCHHCHDMAPGTLAFCRERGEEHLFNDPSESYRSLGYVKRECAKLAAQIVAALPP